MPDARSTARPLAALASLALFTALALASAARQDEPALERAPRALAPREARALGVGAFVVDAHGLDLAGRRTSWRAAAGERGTVLFTTSLTCPLCQRFSPAVARAEDAARALGFGTAHLVVGGLDGPTELAEHAALHGLDGPVLRDEDGELAQALDLVTTTEVFVVDAASTLRYRGALSDQYGIGYAHDAPRHAYLADALAALVAGREVPVSATWAPGCLVERERTERRPAGEVTYARHVARLVRENCLECHRTGGVAPFALETYEQVRRRASTLLAVVEDGLMPPWFAAPADAAAGHGPWRNDRSLLPHEVELLRAWVAAGAPAGDPAELPAPREFQEDGWQIGSPDAVYALPEPFDVPAEGLVRYQYTAVPTGLERDRWVAAIEVRPGAVEVVHHVLAWALPAEAFEGGRFARWDLLDERRGFFAAWAPGVGPVTYPEGRAKLLPAGSVLMFEVHYTTNGRPARDRTAIGVRFADDGPDWRPEKVVRVVGISNHGIEVPAGARAHAERSLGVASRALEVEAFLPHMHLRGASFRYDLERADGERTTLLEVPRYDFKWQLRYELERPVRLEPGDQLRVEGVFDNSRANPANPDPAAVVRWGLQTEDEMLIGFVEYTLVDEDLSVPPAEPLIATFEPRAERQLVELARRSGGELLRERLHGRFHATFDLFDRDGDGRVGPQELPLLREAAGR